MSSKKHTPTKSGSGENLLPEKLKATDWAILKHVSLYHLTTRHAVEELFFNSLSSKADNAAKAGTALDVLARHGYLKNREDTELNKASSKKAAPRKADASQDNQQANQGDEGSQIFKMGSIKYYILGARTSELEASHGFKFIKERLKPPSTEQSLYKHLAALWYCIFDTTRRYRLNQKEIETLVGHKLPHSPAYCLAEEEHGPVIYRIYPCTKKNLKQVPKEVLDKLEEDRQNRGLQDWIESGHYGYAVMVSSEARKSVALRALERERKGNELLAKAKITVHYAPKPDLLSKVLKEREDRGQERTSSEPSAPLNPPHFKSDPPPSKALPKDDPHGFSFSIDT